MTENVADKSSKCMKKIYAWDYCIHQASKE